MEVPQLKRSLKTAACYLSSKEGGAPLSLINYCEKTLGYRQAYGYIFISHSVSSVLLVEPNVLLSMHSASFRIRSLSRGHQDPRPNTGRII